MDFGRKKAQHLLQSVARKSSICRRKARLGPPVCKILNDDGTFPLQVAVFKLQRRNIAMRVDVVEVLPLIRCAIILIDLDEFDVETQLVCAGTTATNFTF